MMIFKTARFLTSPYGKYVRDFNNKSLAFMKSDFHTAIRFFRRGKNASFLQINLSIYYFKSIHDKIILLL